MDQNFNGLQDKGIDNEGTINGIPATEAGYWENHLAVIDLNLKKVGGKWTIVESKTDKPHAVSADTKAASGSETYRKFASTMKQP